MTTTRYPAIVLLALFLASAAGCIRYSAMTYTVVAVSRDNAGTVTVEGSGGSGQLTRPGNAVGMKVSITNNGTLISVTVTDVAPNAITFTVTHPDHPDRTVTIPAGKSQDIFPGDGNAGVRVSVASP